MPFKVKPKESVKKLISQPYAFDVVDENKIRAQKKHGIDYLIDFGIGDPSDPTPEAIRESVKQSVDATKTKGYPASIGGEDLRQAITKYMGRRFNVNLNPCEVVNTYGSKYACFQISSIFLEPGKDEHSLIPNPGYPPFAAGTLFAGGRPWFINLVEENHYQPDLEQIPGAVVDKAKIIFVNNPHSPTAQTYGVDKLKEIVDFCLDNDIILVSDECYCDLYYDEPPKSILEVAGADECSILLHSLSKRSMMTGYAVGFFASKNPEILNAYASIQRKSIQGVANVIQDAAGKAYEDEIHPQIMREKYRERLQAIVPALEHLGCEVVPPQGTFFLWVKVPEGEEPLSFSERLLMDYGVNCVPGNLISETFNEVNPGEKHVRFALVPPIEKTRQAASRLKKK
ncbi:MAG: aminotransferase class I/II-fold pyridoxal phosphate-dependent enzyme [Candidatus Altiarchaeales archaeon]|nr:aminotransferase class I/II-fold pyridoxal phosphate-dependent enzyme [Candidatus Altiarchaeales archaeon]